MVLCVENGDDGVPFVKLGKYMLRLDLEELDESFKERSKVELRETPEVVESALRQLRSLIKENKDLYVPIEDTSYLLKFLRRCKFYSESSYKLMKKFYEFKLNHPELVINLMKRIQKVFEEGVVTFMPFRCVRDSRLLILNIDKWNTKNFTVNDIFSTIMVAVEIGMLEPKTQVAGVHVIFDMQGLSLKHVLQVSPATARTFLYYIQECAAIRINGAHIVNQSIIFNMLFAIFKPFIGEKLRKQIHFHGSDMESLHQYIPKEFLKKNYGGTLDIPHCPGNLMTEMIGRYENKFEYILSIGYIEDDKK